MTNTTDKGWGETFEKLLERYADYDGDSDTMYFKTVVPNMETRNLDDNYQIFLVKAQELIQHIAKEEYERGRKDARQDIDKLYYSEEVAEQEDPIYQAGMIDGILRAKEAALETPTNQEI